jgi:hypothetical protein
MRDPLQRTGERRELSRLARESFSMERYGAETMKNYRALLEST